MKTLLKVFLFITLPVWIFPVLLVGSWFFLFKAIYLSIDDEVEKFFKKRELK